MKAKPIQYFAGFEPLNLTLEVKVRGLKLLGLRVRLIELLSHMICRLAGGGSEFKVTFEK